MFRSKKKNQGGRKRRDVEVESRDEVSAAVHDVEKQPTGPILPLSTSEEVESDLHMLGNLRRSRSRPIRSAMTFSSKCTLNGSSGKSGHTVDTAVFSTETIGLLSFDDGEHHEKQKKRKMRPNLVASSTVDLEVEKDLPNQYSAEMLSSLRSEQSVQFASQRKELLEDIEMHEVERGSDERSKGMEEEDENFIALEGEKKKKLYSKRRVTFGKNTDDPEVPKTTEVVEEVSAEEDDEDQTKRWEEELMRRGGHLKSVAPEAKERFSRDGPTTYPTRRKVTCVSLGSVISKLESSLKATTAEDERVSGEVVRSKAEAALIKKTLKHQQEELLASCEEFEYFQEIEDFVKGLSFCLREKLPVIQAKEQKILDERVRRVKTLQQEEKNGINKELGLWLHSGVLQQSDIFGLNHVAEIGTAVESLTNDTQHAVRMDKYRQHFTETYVADLYPEEEDLFVDAIDEINSLERVYGKFQEWNAKFPEVYKSTYCELAQEKFFAPYVLAELLYWDPLSVTSAESKIKSFDEFTWYRVLRQHVRQSSACDTVNGPLLYQIRNILLTKIRVAVSSYFDPYSSLQVRSLSQVLEEINRHGFFTHVTEAVTTLVNTALEAFVNATKCTMLVAINQSTATAHEDVNVFAHYLLERFNTLQDNLLTLFVGLPKGPIASAGFRSLLQVLYQLLAYIRFCREIDKVQLIATATQVVRQLSGSSYVYQILSEPKQERELKHMIALFKPYLPNSDHQM